MLSYNYRIGFNDKTIRIAVLNNERVKLKPAWYNYLTSTWMSLGSSKRFLLALLIEIEDEVCVNIIQVHYNEA